MDEVQKIYHYLNTTDKILVFTSETTARNAILSFIEKYPGKAVFPDRAISWDRFLLSLKDTFQKREITKTERKVFAYSFLKSGGLDKMEAFASPKYKESTLSYSSYIASLLPLFPSEDDSIITSIPKKMLNDIKIIRKAYCEYLESHNLFERNYISPDYSKIEKNKYVFVFPSTFTSAEADKIVSLNLVDVIKEDKGDERLIEYENSLSEIRGTLRAIEKDREKYNDDEIAITSSSLSTYRPYLESEAKKRDIPLVFTSSEMLSTYPEGRLMQQLYSLYSSSWAFEEMKKLLLDPIYPFKDRKKFISILRRAVDKRIENKGIKSWMSVLEGDEKSLLLSLIHSVQRIVKSSKSRMTLLSIKEFRDTYFMEGKWNEEEDRVFGSILNLLESMGEDEINGLFSLFLSLLDETGYVERSDSEAGIRVYAYPASCGLITKVHYIIGLDDRTTEKRIDDYPFLLSGGREVRNITESLLNIYRSSHFTSKTVLSGTTEGFDGARLLPPLFLESAVKSKAQASDAYTEEGEYWRENKKPNLKPYLTQALSYEKAKNTSLKRRKTEVKIKSFVEENISLSVSRVRDYDQCPYRGYVATRLKIEDKNFSPLLEDPRAVGVILHNTIEKAIEEAGRISDIDDERLEFIFLEELEKAVKRRDITEAYTYEHIKGKYENKLEGIKNANKAHLYSSLNLVQNEVEINGYPLTGEVTINGRVDTILSGGDKKYIIDWKTGGSSDYSSSSLSDTSLQIILYALLLDDDIAGGAFYSIKDENYKVVWPTESYYQKNGVKKTEGYTKEAVIINSKERLEKIITHLESGDFTPHPKSGNCSLCPYFRLCRSRFAASKEERDDK